MRLTKKVFTDLAIFMCSFGLIIGIIFPFFSVMIGIPEEYIFNYIFITSSILAGITLGIFNVMLARLVVGKRLEVLSEKMKLVNENLQSEKTEDFEECMNKCLIPIDSDDVIGESANSFNDLVKSFLGTLRSESSLREFTEIFTKELDLLKLSNKALEHLIRFTDSSAGMIIIDQGGYLEVASSHLLKNPDSILNMEIVHKVFTSKEREIFGFDKDVKIEAGLLDFYPKSILIEPITYKNEVLGIYLLASLRDLSKFSQEELNVYNHGLSLGMHNAIIHDKLNKLAVLDPLTKTFNRRFGTIRLEEEFGRSIRTNAPIGLIMFDLDYFKNVNDTYGHIVGDKVLINFSKLVKENLRKEDVLIRYGGEEFLAILPGASISGVKSVAEKIRRVIEENRVLHENQEVKVTVSSGATSFPEFDAKEVEELIKRADKNLYTAKETGRNKVIAK